MAKLVLCDIATDVSLEARDDGLYIAAQVGKVDYSALKEWSDLRSLTPLGKLLKQNLMQLLERGLIESREGEASLPYASLKELDEFGFEILTEIVPWAPFSISFSANGFVGSTECAFHYNFVLGRQRAFVERVGPFLRRQRTIYRLSPGLHELVDSVDQFNSLPPQEKSKQKALETLSRLKQYQKLVSLDEYLASEEIVLPGKVQVDFRVGSDGLLSLVPRFEGVPSEQMANEFLRFSDVQSVYDIQTAPGKRLRVLLSEELQTILKDMQKIRHVGGARKELVLVNVMGCFSDGTNKELIDLRTFAPRVKGIGDPPERLSAWIAKPSRDWGDSQTLLKGDDKVTLQVQGIDETSSVEISTSEFLEVVTKAEEADGKGESSIEIQGKRIFLDEGFWDIAAEVRRCSQREIKAQPEKALTAAKNSRYLLIYTNEEDSEYQEGNVATELLGDGISAEIPKSLKPFIHDGDGGHIELKLKPHQLEGLRWLQHLFRNRHLRRGGLLADDMGLGKTLQTLSFLAWCIEKGYPEGLGTEVPPWEPILVVAPIILLENWEEELTKYFPRDLFEPILILREKELQRLTRKGPKGRELALGSPKLDVSALRENRLVITNYDTVKNYQHSFARVPWSVIVTDEAQEFKVQNAKSDALKALKAVFKIVATGTPVENRLLDLWNLMDYIQPGSLLGSSKAFSERYEKPLVDDNRGAADVAIEELRNRLFFKRKDSFVLRRDKETELKHELKEKIETRLYSDLSETQRSLHIDMVSRLKEGDVSHHLSLIPGLKKLYMHPFLLDALRPVENIEEFTSACPKLRSVIELLTAIRAKGEKVLVFSEYWNMQTILSEVIGRTFGLNVDVISGNPDSPRKSQKLSRRDIIREFSQKPGFNVLILSPRSAGVGLTITAANHVIHYDRWWNPAKEAQATDRAYRIGQKKNVHVYYCVARDPQRKFKTFDEKLDELLEDKKKVAKDFLVPSESGTITEEELLGSLKPNHDETPSAKAQPVYSSLDSLRGLTGELFEALVLQLYRRGNYRTYLTPRTGDRGVDVVAVSNSEIVLVQAKFTTSGFLLTSEGVSDLLDASEYYRGNILGPVHRRLGLRRIAVTNGKFDQDAVSLAKREGVEILQNKDLEKLLRRHNITKGEVVSAEMDRRNEDELKATLLN